MWQDNTDLLAKSTELSKAVVALGPGYWANLTAEAVLPIKKLTAGVASAFIASKVEYYQNKMNALATYGEDYTNAINKFFQLVQAREVMLVRKEALAKEIAAAEEATVDIATLANDKSDYYTQLFAGQVRTALARRRRRIEQ